MGDIIDFVDFRNRTAIEGIAEDGTDEDLVALSDALLTMYNQGILKVTYDENDEPLFQLEDDITEEQWEHAKQQFMDVQTQEVY